MAATTSRAILLAIRPEYVRRIFNGSKTYEFRKRLAKEDCDVLLIYCTAPISKVVGTARIAERMADTPEGLWNKTKDAAGISREAFMDYFKNSPTAYAYKLEEIEEFANTRELKSYGVTAAPQSFVYIEDLEV